MIESGDLCQKLLGGETKPLLDVKVEVSQYIKITKVSQSIGVFPFVLVPALPKISFTIGKVISFPLSKQVEFTFSSHSDWTVQDGKGKQWVLNFRDPKEANRALAVLGLVSCVTDTGAAASFDAKKAEEGAKPVSLGDTVKINYACFSVGAFPYLDQLVAVKDGVNAKLGGRRLPKALADAVVGMGPGATRVIYLPEVGESGWPSGAFVFVVDVVKVKHGGEGSDNEDEDEPLVPVVAHAVRAAEPKAEVKEEPAEEPAEEPEEPAEKEEEPAPELTEEEMAAQEKMDRIRRMQRLGAVAGPIVPTLPKAAPKPAPAPKPTPAPAPVQTEPVEEPAPPKKQASPVQQAAPKKAVAAPAKKQQGNVKHLEERVEQFARTIDRKLDAVVQSRGQVDVEAVISGITSLAVQARTKQAEIDQLQKRLDDVRSKNAGNSTAVRQLEAARQELEDGQRRAVLIDKKVKEGNRKLRELEKSVADTSKKAKEKGTRMIKLLMSNVFADMTTAFEDEGRYTGQEVQAQLRELLRKHSFTMMSQVEQEGLI